MTGTMIAMTSTPLVRDCAECGQRDTHPRHVVGVVNRPGTPSRRPPVPRHIDCCAASGCGPCGQTVTESGGLTGQALIDWLAAQRAARARENDNG